MCLCVGVLFRDTLPRGYALLFTSNERNPMSPPSPLRALIRPLNIFVILSSSHPARRREKETSDKAGPAKGVITRCSKRRRFVADLPMNAQLANSVIPTKTRAVETSSRRVFAQWRVWRRLNSTSRSVFVSIGYIGERSDKLQKGSRCRIFLLFFYFIFFY